MKIPFLQLDQLFSAAKQRKPTNGEDFVARQAGFVDFNDMAAAHTKAKEKELPVFLRDTRAEADAKSAEAGRLQAEAEEARRDADELEAVALNIKADLAAAEQILSDLQQANRDLDDMEARFIEQASELQFVKSLYGPSVYANVYDMRRNEAYYKTLGDIAVSRKVLPARIKTVQAHITELKARIIK